MQQRHPRLGIHLTKKFYDFPDALSTLGGGLGAGNKFRRRGGQTAIFADYWRAIRISVRNDCQSGIEAALIPASRSVRISLD